MLNPDLIRLFLFVAVIIAIPMFCLVYFNIFQIAIRGALKEQHGEYTFNRLIIVGSVIIPLIGYFSILLDPQMTIPSVVQGVANIGIFYLAIEIPYQLVKYAAKRMIHELEAAGDDKREMARETSARTLADIISKKLNITCDLQAFTSNEEFIFLTYIVNNKPIATRLKIAQADNAENWKKLGDWIMQSYKKESSQ